jgi:hypothetical protein
MRDFFLYVYIMKTNRAIKILTISLVIAFFSIQTQYASESSSSIISVVCFLLKDMDWNEFTSNHGTRVFGLTVIGMLVLNISILTAAFMNRRRLVLWLTLLHVGYWCLLINIYGFLIILVSSVPYLVFAMSLVGLLISTWFKGKINKRGVS